MNNFKKEVVDSEEKPSTVPATPKCPYFGKCGGCLYQNIPYESQLEKKRNLLANATGMKKEEILVFSGEEYFYRNRMDMVFHPGGIGLRERGNWRNIIDVESCAISNQKLNSLISEVRTYFRNADSFDVRKNSGTFRYAVIRTPQSDSSISFVLNSDSTRLADAIEKIKDFATKSAANNILVTYVPSKTDMSISDDFFVVKGKDSLEETFMGKKFFYSIQGFFQNNHEMADKMHGYVNDLIASTPNTTDQKLLDLYGGVGTFGIINSSLFKTVEIVESVKQCIDAANENIKLNCVINANATVLDAMQLKKLGFKSTDSIFMITDPPRSGMHPKTIQNINEFLPKHIIYISCNLEQLGKDLKKFSSYRIKSAALFDLFPQTPHAEGVVEMEMQN